MAAAARLAAMRERIKGKQDVVNKAVTSRIADDIANEKQQEIQKREERRLKLVEEAKQKAAAELENKAKRQRLEAEQAPKMITVVPKCTCALEAVLKKVSKEGAHCGREYYGCSRKRDENGCKLFVWSALCQFAEAGTDAQSGEPTVPLCRCGLEANSRVVKKEGPNLGKTFYGCPRPKEEGACGFFEWAKAASDAPPAASTSSSAAAPSDSDAPKCTCGLKCVARIVKKEGPNLGRSMYTCSKPKSEGACNFFAWAVETKSSSSVATLEKSSAPGAAAGGKNCLCGIEAGKFLVQKDGPTKGRSFLKCKTKTCKYFEWEAAAGA